ncbi:MEKHLA domain-containing protein [Brochothrix thermosphacta]|uniref:MEKHLA domain-containing protein n=1 Tax=Brochothrix thermosphacta TaxID=2756 RepID=UPI0003E8A8D7|nr:MEKHLA domain-containing protein [Brochothrix thermosphacta]EUJ36697.1 hypothetical protein BTHER_06734 [Brochothrix thermosphacta DSM 20171 = FSL F6-1036]ODJ49099.1 hypothetical protein BFR34_07360 [Brochothrix thermosphacta DSM 20171 = FSL F6-1036]
MDGKKRDQILSLIDASYKIWMGENLPISEEKQEEQRQRWLEEEAPYGLLVQNIAEDPHFIYANQHAQTIFGYSLEQFLALPSRKSAPPQNQKQRNEMLEEVTLRGISNSYTGTRIDSNGQLFEITEGSIWKVINESGEMIGIAAMIKSDKDSLTNV